MRHFLVFVCACVALALAAPAVDAQAATGEVPTPESVFGFTPGADRKLIDYSQQIGYLEQLAQASPRVVVEEIGRSTLDRPMVMVFISSEENLGRLEELKRINRRLALDPAIPDEERTDLIGQARVFVMATLSMHSTEVGPAQTLPLLAHRLATAEDEQTLAVLDDVVVMVVACLNPDGMDMVVHHYRENLGTRYEGASMPGLYHHYVGHDNNRDFVTLSQAESRVVSRVFSTEWYPQVLIDKHQMGRTGPRYFVPRYHDPIAENIDGKLWTWSDVFGSGMAREIAHEGLTGVASNWVFDEYWPGATTTSHWKGVISLLTEAASVRVATPVFVEKNERRVRGKGLSEYKKSVNMPSPWPGGWWRLGDIVDYELASWTGALNTASMLRTEILTLRNDLCREEVERGRNEAPAYYVVPGDQHDASERDRLVSLLIEHGVEVAKLSGPVALGGRQFDAGDIVVPMAQAYRPFVKEVMESQAYPVRHYTPGGEIIKPYDITSWSLPLHYGVEAVELDARSEELESLLVAVQDRETAAVETGSWGLALDPRDNASFRVAFDLLADGKRVHRTTVAAPIGGAELPPGSFVVEASADDLPGSAADARAYLLDEAPTVAMTELAGPRVALIETWFHDMDGGWTRYLLEYSKIPFTTLHPGDVAGADLAKNFDVVIFPDADENVLTEGSYKSKDEYRVNDYRPEHQKGLGKEGAEAVTAFIESGGMVISWGRSTALLFGNMTFGEGDDTVEFELPVHDRAEALAEEGFYAPGSLLAVELLPDHPLTWGMPATTGVFTRGRPVLGTGLPMLDTDRRVIGSFPAADIVLSGFAENAELLAEQPAMVWVRAGKGQLVLFGFQPQFRFSTPTTFKLLYNAILLPRLEEGGVAGADG